MNDFNPMEASREPRSEGYRKETQQIIKHLENRGDQRIGQLLINAARTTESYKYACESDSFANHNEAAEQVLWSMEAPELLKALNKLNEDIQ